MVHPCFISMLTLVVQTAANMLWYLTVMGTTTEHVYWVKIFSLDGTLYNNEYELDLSDHWSNTSINIPKNNCGVLIHSINC